MYMSIYIDINDYNTNYLNETMPFKPQLNKKVGITPLPVRIATIQWGGDPKLNVEVSPLRLLRG